MSMRELAYNRAFIGCSYNLKVILMHAFISVLNYYALGLNKNILKFFIPLNCLP